MNFTGSDTHMITYPRAFSAYVFACVIGSISTTVALGETADEAITRWGGKATRSGGAVTQLQVSVDSFTDADYRILGSLSSLKKLSIGGKTLNDTTLPLLAGLTQLEELSTDRTMLTDEGYKHFRPLQSLRSLALFHPSWDMKTFTGSGLAELKALPKLERLTFAGSTAGDEAMAAIGQLTQLREFRTWHTAQTHASNVHLLNLKDLRGLRIGQRLPHGRGPSPASFDESTIPLIAQLKKLERLELTEARLAAGSLSPLQSLPNLKQLTLQDVDITPEDVASIQKQLPSVKINFQPMTESEKEALLAKKLRI